MLPFFPSSGDRGFAPMDYHVVDSAFGGWDEIEALSKEYDLTEGTRTLDGAGDCIWMEASVIKGTNNMAPQIQTVYIIPAPDGCRIATAHCAIEASEGFGRRFAYMLNTLSVISR